MSKIICEECNKEIDDTTKQCPNCGYKNKLDLDLYLKVKECNKCPKCGNKISKNDSFCTKCGYKKNNFKSKTSNIKELVKVVYKRNKLISKIIIALILFVIIGVIYTNNFNSDMLKAEEYYNSKEFYEAEKIVKKYPINLNNATYKKVQATKYLTFYYDKLGKYDDDIEDYTSVIKSLLRGYESCEDELSIKKEEIEKQAINDLKDLYRYELVYTYKLSDEEIKSLSSLESEELDNQLYKIAKGLIKSNTCEIRNIDVLSYYGSSYEMSVTLKNNNGCTWNIKSYSKVRVYFTDGSYEDVYLGTNINLKVDEQYTFSDCYLGSNNKYKTIKSVSFIG